MYSEWEIHQREHDRRVAEIVRYHAMKRDPRRVSRRFRLPHLLQFVLRILS